MEILYAITLLVFATLSGIFFMLVKTWVIIQFIKLQEGKYVARPKDKLWRREGWVAVLVFCLICILFHFLLIMDFKIAQ